jgi:hypothetical protein
MTSKNLYTGISFVILVMGAGQRLSGGNIMFGNF